MTKADVKILVDYLSFSIARGQFTQYEERDHDDLFLALCQLLALDPELFEERGGYHGYTVSYWYNGITLAYGGCNETVHVNMSGSGCRVFESLRSGHNWEHWIRQLRKVYSSWHCSRIDIAADTVGDLDIHTLQNWTDRGWYKSQWRTYLVQRGNAENSIIWGSPKSDFRLRIYDKTLERRRQVDDPDEVPEKWVRCEFQMRNDAAESFIREWLGSGDISAAYFGIMRNQLIYTKDYDGKNADRMTIASWWKKFLGNYQQLKMAYPGGVEYNFQSLTRYLFKQCSSSIRTYMLYNDGDLSGLLEKAEHAKINEKQRQLLLMQEIMTDLYDSGK